MRNPWYECPGWLSVAAGGALVGAALAGQTAAAFWGAAALFAGSVAMLGWWDRLPPRWRPPLYWNVDFAFIAFGAGVWVVMAVLPRGNGTHAPAVPSAVGKAAASLVAAVGVAASVPMAVYLALEIACAVAARRDRIDAITARHA